jgi:hypothetical protein
MKTSDAKGTKKKKEKKEETSVKKEKEEDTVVNNSHEEDRSGKRKRQESAPPNKKKKKKNTVEHMEDVAAKNELKTRVAAEVYAQTHNGSNTSIHSTPHSQYP